MADHIKSHNEVPVSNLLPRIADALGLPVSCLHATGSDGFPAADGVKLNAHAVLGLVAAYLQVADLDARRQFIEAVKALVEHTAI